MISGLGRFNLLFAVDAKSKYKTLERFHRGRQGQSRQAQYRHHRGRRHAKSRRRIVQVDGRRQCRDRAVQEFARHRGGAVAQRRADAGRIPGRRSAARSTAGKLRVLASSAPQREAVDAECADGRARPASKATRWRPGTACSRPRARRRRSIDAMGKAMHEVLAMPDVKEQYAKVGVEAHASHAGRTDEPAQERHQEVECGDRQGGHPAQVGNGGLQ